MFRKLLTKPSYMAAIFGAALALVSAGEAAGAVERTPNATLLARYQPVLVFHPGEQFRPVKVQPFVESSVLERFVGTNVAQLPHDAFWTLADSDPEPGGLPPATPGVVYRLNEASCRAAAPLGGRDCYAEADSGRPAVYGRVIRTEDLVVLQYWLFYYDNPLILPATPVGTFWQSHEGDWELVNVILDSGEQPVEAAYSQHCSGERRVWDDVHTWPAESTHPIAYVALGSHANYFDTGTGALGEIPISLDCIPESIQAVLPAIPFLHVADQVVDGSSSGAAVGPVGSGLEEPTIHRIAGTQWARFGGRWGESEYFFTPIQLGPVPAGTAVPEGLAPASPANQGAWNASTILAWPLVDAP
jgi:hypothetical protein